MKMKGKEAAYDDIKSYREDKSRIKTKTKGQATNKIDANSLIANGQREDECR